MEVWGQLWPVANREGYGGESLWTGLVYGELWSHIEPA